MRYCRFLMMSLVGGWLIGACVQPYVIPELSSNQTNILVVTAFLNTGNDTIIVNLSRTKAIGAKGGVIKEDGATVTLEDSKGSLITIPRRAQGEYFRQGLVLNPSVAYRLKIKTKDLIEYESKPVTPNATPPIDNVSWQMTDTGVDIYLDSHDASNQTKYYRWDYVETYEFTSAFQSLYVYNRGLNEGVPRDNTNQIYTCWSTTPASTINLGSTVQLTQDVVHTMLLHIPSTSQKTKIRYSILSRQYALDKAQYEYLLNVKKLSESQGTLFDPQPADVTGNLVCTSDPSIGVLGYFSAGTVTEKRIFISGSELPVGNQWKRITDYDNCLSNLLIWVKNDLNFSKYNGLLLYPACDPAQPLCDLNSSIPGYASAPSICIDCQLRNNGKTKRPSFW